MVFRPEEIENFKQIFEAKKERIANFEGCKGVKLFQVENVFFTYSIWENESYLEAYRQSTFFVETWAVTKQLFAEKPEAWTVNEVG